MTKHVNVRWFSIMMALVMVLGVAVLQPVAAEDAFAMKRFDSDLTLMASDLSGLMFEMQFPQAEIVEVMQGETLYHKVTMAGFGHTQDVGKPELPTIGRFFAIPHGAQISVEVLDAAFETVAGVNVYPAQWPTTEEAEPSAFGRVFTKDDVAYHLDAFSPSQVATLDPVMTMRGIKLSSIRFVPAQFNPITAELRVYSRIKVRVTFEGGSNLEIDPRLASPHYQSLFDSAILNSDMLSDAPALTGMHLASTTGCEFLIVTADHLVDAARDLAIWKRQKGLDTEVRTMSEIGSSSGDLQAYIQNAYFTWNPAPSFVLFLGDAEYVPTNYQTIHYYESNTLIGTDLYYAAMDGAGDYLPDISTGRIPVDTLTQAQAVVNKIINYEQNPPTDPAFYNNVTVAAYFQDDNLDGYDDRPFVITSEEIRDFLLGKGYDVERIYEAPGSSNPTNYNNGSYGDGEPLPAELLRSNGFAWDGNASQISAAVNDGCFILNHRDHGSVTSWGHPYYNTGHIGNLGNGGELPVVFSMNCRTGWFDDETDQSTWNAVSFAEQFLRHENGGAVGVVAATRTSFSGHNDLINKGMIDALWDDFIPSYSQGSGPFGQPQRQMGQVLNYGKMYYASIFGESMFRKYEFEIFHYFGDPTMQIWTAPPAQMNVSHSESCTPGATSFEVAVDVDGAVVTVVKGDQLLGKTTVNGGHAMVALDPAPTDGEIKVTAVDPEYAPYGDDVPVGGGTAPTAVTLAGYDLQAGQGYVLVQWETGTELDNMGFNVYRGKKDNWDTAEQLNGDLILSQAFGGMVGASYEYIDDTAEQAVWYYYWLESLDISGTTQVERLGKSRWAAPAMVKVVSDAGEGYFKDN